MDVLKGEEEELEKVRLFDVEENENKKFEIERIKKERELVEMKKQGVAPLKLGESQDKHEKVHSVS